MWSNLDDMKIVRLSSGSLLVELILSIGLFVVVASVIFGSMVGFLKINNKSKDVTSAISYAKEGIEAVRSIRDRDWSSIKSGVYGLELVRDSWQFSGSSDRRDKFNRVVRIEDVRRDRDLNISDSGDIDRSIKRVIVEVSWNNQYTNDNQRVSIITYLSNWRVSEVGASELRDIDSCTDACLNGGYLDGTCRSGWSRCRNGETDIDQYSSYCGFFQNCCCKEE